ncbi:MAG: electron transfer flavoprotein subunit beta/FixA family protein [Candidatus Hodarchaeales archaeon]|jgi:electron transfer flavoprotein beta subunit
MHILVFVKETVSKVANVTPDTTFPGDREKDDVKINEYDLHALEAALRIIEEKEEGKVTAICLGSEEGGDKVVKHAIAMGCQEAIRIDNSEAKINDPFLVSKVLAAAIQKIGDYDLIFFGMQSYDGSSATMAPMVSEHLNLPLACWVETIKFEDEKNFHVGKVIEGGNRHARLQLPAVLSIATTGDYEEYRYTSVRRIMKASRTKVPVWTLDELNIDTSVKSNVNLVSIKAPEARKEKCIVLEDDEVPNLVDKLLEALKERGLNLGAYKQ